MSRATRQALIKKIEEQRGSRVLAAIWGDRENLPTVIAPDAHPLFFQHLERIGMVEKIDVLLYTTGGQTLAAWGLANLVREYCQKLGVFVPHRALSSGTLFSLAADEIVMSRAGQFSPIDPSLTSPLGPYVQVPNQPGMSQPVPISVEDVMGFIELATTEVGLKEERSIVATFERLASQVHPLALGAVYRSRQQILALADRLLQFHMGDDDAKDERDRIVHRLTRELGSHDYLIGRTEAKNFLRLNVIDVEKELDSDILALFAEYEALLDLRSPFNPEGLLGATDIQTGDFNRAVFESTDLLHVFRTSQEIQRVQVPMPGMPFPSAAIQQRVLFQGWVEDATL